MNKNNLLPQCVLHQTTCSVSFFANFTNLHVSHVEITEENAFKIK